MGNGGSSPNTSYMNSCIRSSSTGLCTSPQDNIDQWGNNRGVCIFTRGCSHADTKWKLGIKDYTARDLNGIPRIGSKDSVSNEIDAVQIDDGLIVDAYDGDNFDGRTVRYKGPVDIALWGSNEQAAREWENQISSFRISRDCDSNVFMWDGNCNAHCNNTGTTCYSKRSSNCNSNLGSHPSCVDFCIGNKRSCQNAINSFCNFDQRNHALCTEKKDDILNNGCNFSNKSLPECRANNQRLENILAANCKTSNFNDADCQRWCGNRPNDCAVAFENMCKSNPEQKICTDYLDANTLTTSNGYSLEKSKEVIINYCNTIDKLDKTFCQKYLSTHALRGKADEIVNKYCNINSNKLSTFCSCVNSEQINEYWKGMDNIYLLSKAIARPDCVYPKCVDKISEAYKKDYQSQCPSDTICNITVSQLKQFNQCKDNTAVNVDCNSTVNLVNKCGNDAVNITKIPEQQKQPSNDTTKDTTKGTNNSGVTVNIDINNISDQIQKLLKTSYGIYIIACVVIVFLLLILR